MHLLPLSLMSCALALACSAVQAQRARCVDAKGMGYECSGSMARASEQSALSGQRPQKDWSIDLTKLGQAQWQDTKANRSEPATTNSDPNIHRKPDPLDGWPTTIRTQPKH